MKTHKYYLSNSSFTITDAMVWQQAKLTNMAVTSNLRLELAKIINTYSPSTPPAMDVVIDTIHGRLGCLRREGALRIA